MRKQRRVLTIELDLWTVVLCSLFVAAVLYNVSKLHNPVQSERELDSFRRAYGPDHYTEREEEWFIRDFFQDRRGGFFVDVGANHYQEASKTYFLEKMLAWNGLAIEPQQQYAADYVTHRPRTRFFSLFVSDASDQTAQLYVLKKLPLIASSDLDFIKQFGNPDEVRQVPTVALNDLLDREGVKSFDFLSMDIELHEPEALKGFEIERFKPALVCIEALLPVRQRILDYFATHRYVVVGKFVWVDRENLYFMPLEPATAQP